MYKACIFDLDGTLTDTLESLTYSVNETLRRLGMASITEEQCRRFVGDGARALIERALIASGDEELQNIEEGMKIYGEVFAVNCIRAVAPYEGIVPMLEKMKERGMKLAVLSNKPDAQTKMVVSQFFGTEIFDWVQGQRDDVPKKPDPAAVFEIMDRLGVTQDETIYVGDSDVDMKTGKSAGVFTVGVTWGFRSREVLVEAGADLIADEAETLLECER